MNNYIVFGLGISGNSTIKFLLESGHKVFASDDNKNSLIALDQQIEERLKKNLVIFENEKEIDWPQIKYLILAPGIPFKYPAPHPIVLQAHKNHCPVICDIELFYLFNSSANFLGITGTNGKSTTTALTGHIFKENKISSAIGGNIGIPCFNMPELGNNATYIFETSSFQLDLMEQTHFHIASLLNITPDHLDRHNDMPGYIAAKKRIFNNQTKDDYAVIGVDNANSKKLYEELKNNPEFKARLVPISTKIVLKDGISIIDNVLYNNIEKNSEIHLGVLPNLKGEHNAQNIAVAFANCFLSEINEENIIGAIRSFEGLSHRMKLIGKIDNINFINDSKATNAESTENALKSFENIYWILGGKSKDGGIEILEPYFPKINHAFLIGEASEEFAKVLDGKVEYSKCGDLENAFKIAHKKAQNDKENIEKNILLSPACASFDQWKNFEVRGDYFCKLVKELVADSNEK
jgi:UDP-N-acetylmuramoylalanine--D-glutamate ligase